MSKARMSKGNLLYWKWRRDEVKDLTKSEIEIFNALEAEVEHSAWLQEKVDNAAGILRKLTGGN